MDLGFSGLLDLWFFLGFRIFCFSRVWDFKVFWMFGFSGSFRDLDRFRLLIQRCKRVGEIGNFFDQGRDLPDESTRAPGEGYGRGKARDEALPKFYLGKNGGAEAEW